MSFADEGMRLDFATEWIFIHGNENRRLVLSCLHSKESFCNATYRRPETPSDDSLMVGMVEGIACIWIGNSFYLCG